MSVFDRFGSVRIPKAFVDDHEERGLYTPVKERVAARHYWIDPADPALPELIDDAKYYAFDVDQCGSGLIASAKATLDALKNTEL